MPFRPCGVGTGSALTRQEPGWGAAVPDGGPALGEADLRAWLLGPPSILCDFGQAPPGPALLPPLGAGSGLARRALPLPWRARGVLASGSPRIHPGRFQPLPPALPAPGLGHGHLRCPPGTLPLDSSRAVASWAQTVSSGSSCLDLASSEDGTSPPGLSSESSAGSAHSRCSLREAALGPPVPRPPRSPAARRRELWRPRLDVRAAGSRAASPCGRNPPPAPRAPVGSP